MDDMTASKPFWKRPIGIGIIVFVVLAIIGALSGEDAGDSNTATPETSITPTTAEPTTAEPTTDQPTSTEATEEETSSVDQTDQGLTATTAQTACDMYAERQFPYGYDPHWILGRLAEENRGDHWYLKVEADVTNQYDAERAVNIECYVGGTEKDPVVQEFLAY